MILEPLNLGFDPNEIRFLDGSVIQRVGSTEKYAKISRNRPYKPCSEKLELDQVCRAWNSKSKVEIDVHINIEDTYLETQYQDTLFGTTELTRFCNHVLSRSRIGLSNDELSLSLKSLSMTIKELDEKYNSSEFTELVRKSTGSDATNPADNMETIKPVSARLEELKQRETQMQILIGLELNSLVPDISNCDRHFNRLCIWQAVGKPLDITVSELVKNIVIPYFWNLNRKKCTEFLTISGGTDSSSVNRLKTESKTELQEAHKIRKYKTRTRRQDPLPAILNLRNSDVLERLSPAVRQRTVEISFNRTGSRSASRTNTRSATATVDKAIIGHRSSTISDETLKPVGVTKTFASRAERAQTTPVPAPAIEATPQTTRIKFLKGLEPTTLNFDEIGSTDENSS